MPITAIPPPPGFPSVQNKSVPPTMQDGPIKPLPHVVAWNLTARCNLTCPHCYISAGPRRGGEGDITADECRRIADEIFALVDGPMFVLSGGEPLLRDDLEEIAAHATAGGATVVVGTNGTLLTSARIDSLMEAGVKGVALSVDTLDETKANGFHRVDGGLASTMATIARLREARLDFVIQTTITDANAHELEELATWAASVGAVSFNVFFVVDTGRGRRLPTMGPESSDAVLRRLKDLHGGWHGQMMVRSKCQPQIMRHVYEHDPDSPMLQWPTRCQGGIQYARITPDAKLTLCPYLPEVVGDLRRRSFADIWHGSRLFGAVRRGEFAGKCGRCEYRLICGGCRARAFARSGDTLAADPSCSYEPTGDAALIHPPGDACGAEPPLELEWSEGARARIERIPSFARGMVTARVEKWARQQGHQVITAEMLDELRRSMPVDFSKKHPFFMRDKG